MAAAVSILGHGTKPDNSGNCYQEPAALNFQSNDRYPQMVWVFKNSGAARIALGGRFMVPLNYSSTPVMRLHWGTTATTGDVRLEGDLKAIADGESADPSSDDDAVGSTVTAPGTARLVKVTSISLSGTYVAGDHVQFQVVRDKSDAADTLAADMYLLEAEFVYTAA